MSRIPGLRRWFRLPLTRQTLEREIDDEVEFHLSMRAEELEAAGWNAPEARAQARREFGDVGAARAELARVGWSRIRRARRADVRETVSEQLHWALRMLVREPAFAAAVVLALAAGVGVNAVMFSVTDRLLFRAPPGIVAPEGVGRVYFHATLEGYGGISQPVTTWPLYEALRQVPAVSDAGAFSAAQEVSYGVGSTARGVRAVAATGSVFGTLGTRPAAGRFFSDAESRDGSRVAVVSTPFWQRELGGRALDGVRIRLGRQDYDVVGVAPAGFTGVYLEPVDVWLPMAAAAPELGGPGWDTESVQWLQLVVRRSGVPVPAAEAALVAAAREVDWLLKSDPASRVTLESVVPARGLQPGGSRATDAGRVALWLSGLSLVVLLIACANVANLLLARASRRRREIAVRLALGIGRARLAGQLIMETLVLALLGGVVAVLAAGWAGTALRRLLLPEVEWAGRPVLDGRMLAFGFGVVMLAVLLAGLAPALHAVRTSVHAALGQGVRSGAVRSRLRSALVVVQAALCVALLAGAGVFVRSLHNLRAVDPGFTPANLVAVQWPAASLPLSRPERLELYEASRQALSRMPEVLDVALAAVAPLTASISTGVRGEDEQATSLASVHVNAVSPEYLGVIGTDLRRGRAFTAADRAGAEDVAILSESLAARLWPGADPLDRCLRFDGADTCARVVGVIEDPRGVGPASDAGLLVLVPLAQDPTLSPERTLLVRLRSPEALGRVRATLQTIRPGLAHVRARSYDDILAPVLRPWHMGARLFSAIGVLALAMATLGLYAVVAYDVSRRQHELSVRVALGAGRAALARLVIGDAARLLAAGVALGLAAAVLLAARLEPLLFGVSPADPLILGAAAAVLVLSGLLAAALPARRASRADPVRALREE